MTRRADAGETSADDQHVKHLGGRLHVLEHDAIIAHTMVQNFKQVGPQRYRETFGRYFEDFVIGDVYEHRPGRTITQHDNISFALLTMNTHPLHFDEQYAKATEFGRCLVSSPLARRPTYDFTFHFASMAAVAVKTWDSAIERSR